MDVECEFIKTWWNFHQLTFLFLFLSTKSRLSIAPTQFTMVRVKFDEGARKGQEVGICWTTSRGKEQDSNWTFTSSLLHDRKSGIWEVLTTWKGLMLEEQLSIFFFFTIQVFSLELEVFRQQLRLWTDFKCKANYCWGCPIHFTGIVGFSIITQNTECVSLSFPRQFHNSMMRWNWITFLMPINNSFAPLYTGCLSHAMSSR